MKKMNRLFLRVLAPNRLEYLHHLVLEDSLYYYRAIDRPLLKIRLINIKSRIKNYTNILQCYITKCCHFSYFVRTKMKKNKHGILRIGDES